MRPAPPARDGRPNRYGRSRTRSSRVAACAAVALALGLSACGSPGDDGPTENIDAALSTGVPTVLVVDASASMLIDDAPGPRIDAAKAAADGLIGVLPDDAVLGLVTYGTSTDDAPGSQEAGCRDVTTLAEPAPIGVDEHRGTLSQQVDALDPSGYTPIAESLRQAAGLLPEGDSAVIVISDGEDSCGDPPCEAAAKLREQNPRLRISTVGFKTATPELACIARTTDGLFVTADDADQLATRLMAARDIDGNSAVLTPTGLGGIDLGTHYNDIVGTHPDFPAQSAGTADGEDTIITYVDCDYLFDSSGTVIEIRPHDGRTVDGLAVGDQVSRAVELYGEPVEATDGTTRLFAASREAGTAWKITADGDRISRIVLCRCLPGTGASSAAGSGSGATHRSTTISGQTEIVVYNPYLYDGSLAPGFGELDGEVDAWGCGPMDEDLFRCGRMYTDGSIYFCSTDGSTAWCPSRHSTGELEFTRHARVQILDGSYDPRSGTEPVPVYVDLTNGDRCWFHVQLGNIRMDATERFLCPGEQWLWEPAGGKVFANTTGTWTALKAPGSSSAPFEKVTVARAVFID
ncbi:VWA domain-containing protein [Dietzia sp. UCD-THP]|uniref:vWA domain-containing protein n=1 Tax=Dietzia sp. UCD-THP TaxID=1292020 RepID=UPI0009DB3286|nr:VWA domain-containing protein [Dietzia sp. UCD-THP]